MMEFIVTRWWLWLGLMVISVGLVIIINKRASYIEGQFLTSAAEAAVYAVILETACISIILLLISIFGKAMN